MTEPKKAKPKKGKVIRISERAWSYLEEHKEGSTIKTVDQLIVELNQLTMRLENILSSPTKYILPESKLVCDSLEEARGQAILNAVRKGRKKPTEEPVEVKVI